MRTESAGIWYDIYDKEREQEDKNIHSYLCRLREELIPKIGQDTLWKQYNGCQHIQLGERGKPAPLNQYAQKLEELEIRGLDKDGERMMRDQIKKMKFVHRQIPALREKVRPPVAS